MNQERNDVVERYVYDVCRRLPEKERVDVKKDLTASIFESLDGKNDDETVGKVLESFGSPASLADEYRTTPQYLISPAMYEMYNKTVTRMMIIVGIIFGGAALFEFLIQKGTGFGDTLSDLGDVCFAIARGMAYAFFYTTVIYKTIDSGYFSDTKKWSVADLPKHVPIKYNGAPVDGAADITRAVFILFTLLIGFIVPELISSVNSISVFDRSFLIQAIIVLIIFVIFTLFVAAVKLRYKDWCKQVRNAVIISDIVYIVGLVYLFSHPLLFTVHDNDRPVTDKIQTVFVLISVVLLSWDIRKAIDSTKQTEQTD
jgi:uncharacterized protein (DUF486 family)